MRLFAILVTLAVLGYVSSASVICTDYAAGGGGGSIEGYYVRPIPAHCHARHLGRWRPTFRIKEPWSDCKDGFRKYKNACYKLARGNANINFRDGEQTCNRHQGHMVTWKNREEFMWINHNVANQNKWYWVGTFCGQGRDVRNLYTVTGEDMRKIGPRWGFRNAHNVNMNNQPCNIWLRNNGTWMKQFHWSSCNEGRGAICKSPLA